MLQIFQYFKPRSADLVSSRLYDELTFYPEFERDLGKCRDELLIESPFITTRRTAMLLPTLQKLIKRGVRVTVNTRHPQEHDEYLRLEAEENVALLQEFGVEVLYTGGHHRKLAILDRKVLWEGSLNILSQNDSCEIMRRIDSAQLAGQMIRFVKVNKFS